MTQKDGIGKYLNTGATNSSCDNWKNNTNSYLWGTRGTTYKTDATWTDNGEIVSCNNKGRLYCIEQPTLTTPTPVIPTPTYAFPQITPTPSFKTTCIDSDAYLKPNDIYNKGSVTYTDASRSANTIYDECSGSNLQVNEMWCYESPAGTGNYVAGRMVYNCPNGCLNGACLKAPSPIPTNIPQPTAIPTKIVWQATDPKIYHQIGRAEGTDWSANTVKDSPGFLNYGPYITTLKGGMRYSVAWTMLVDVFNPGWNDVVAMIQIHDASTWKVVAERNIMRNEFLKNWTYKDFSLSFTAQAGQKLEFRTYWYQRAYIKLDKITLIAQ